MSKEARIVGNINHSDDYGESYYYSLVITPELKENIKRLQKVAIDNDVYKISEFDYRIDVFTLPYDTEIKLECEDEDKPTLEQIDNFIESEDNGQRLDICLLNVTKDYFWYEAIIKHTSIQLETCMMNLDEVERAEACEDYLNVTEW